MCLHNNKNYTKTIFKKSSDKLEKEVMKILKELRKAINRNADYYKKVMETIRRSQEKLENSFVKMKAELVNEEQNE